MRFYPVFYLPLVVLSLFAVSAGAQKKALSETMGSKICDCFQRDKKGSVEERFSRCFEKTWSEQAQKQTLTANPDSIAEWKKHTRAYAFTHCDLIIRLRAEERPALYDGTKNKKAQAAYDLASKSLRVGEYTLAKEYFLEAWQYDSTFIEALDNLALSHRKDKEYDQAEQYYRKSLEIEPRGHFAQQNLAVTHLYQERYDDALAAYHRMIDSDPSNPEAYYGLANTLLILKRDLGEAEILCDTVILLYEKTADPLLPDGYRLKGYAQYYADKKDEARKTLQKAMDMGAKIDRSIIKDLQLKVKED